MGFLERRTSGIRTSADVRSVVIFCRDREPSTLAQGYALHVLDEAGSRNGRWNSASLGQCDVCGAIVLGAVSTQDFAEMAAEKAKEIFPSLSNANIFVMLGPNVPDGGLVAVIAEEPIPA